MRIHPQRYYPFQVQMYKSISSVHVLDWFHCSCYQQAKVLLMPSLIFMYSDCDVNMWFVETAALTVKWMLLSSEGHQEVGVLVSWQLYSFFLFLCFHLVPFSCTPPSLLFSHCNSAFLFCPQPFISFPLTSTFSLTLPSTSFSFPPSFPLHFLTFPSLTLLLHSCLPLRSLHVPLGWQSITSSSSLSSLLGIIWSVRVFPSLSVHLRPMFWVITL